MMSSLKHSTKRATRIPGALRNRQSPNQTRTLTKDTINPAIVNAEYAVRGAIPIRALELAEQLKKPDNKLPFKKLIMCNIGNPQAVSQEPFTFIREVIGTLINKHLLDSADVSEDARKRARKYRDQLPMNSIGGYSDSRGVPAVRQEVADFIAARDGEDCRPELHELFLTDGASPGIKYVLSCLIRGPQDGILIPIPQYPLYSAAIALGQGTAVPYELNEESSWSVDFEQMQMSLDEAHKKGVTPRAMVVINPGNPTGSVLSESDMEELIRVARKNNLVILADEVYQENVYTPRKKFHSFKKIMRRMGEEVELFSFHSTSKGFLGECGLRGGYMELSNIDPFVEEQIYKCASVCLCSNTTGQIAVGVMVNPPKPGDATFELYKNERDEQLGNLNYRATMLTEELNKIKGISSQPVEGAMYAFPKIELSEKAMQAAKERGMAPDGFWCMELLESTGIVTVPGSGFGQKKGTWHFRTTILPTNEDLQYCAQQIGTFQESFLAKYG